jgi:hypothetical protein
MNDQVVAKLLNEDFFVPAMIGTGVVIIVAIRSFASVLRTFAREKTRREIAAFIAEGSMSPEQGERLMKAGTKDC